MKHTDDIDKVVAQRGEAFRRGVLGGDARMLNAFRDLNRRYVTLRHPRRRTCTSPATRNKSIKRQGVLW